MKGKDHENFNVFDLSSWSTELNGVIILFAFTLTVEDADGDSVRCRWADSMLNECGGVCSTFPANLNEITVGCYQLQF